VTTPDGLPARTTKSEHAKSITEAGVNIASGSSTSGLCADDRLVEARRWR